MQHMQFICYQFDSLRNKIIPSEMGKIGSIEDHGIMVTGTFTDALRIRLEKKLGGVIITAKETLVFTHEPKTETDVVNYCIGLYQLGQTMKDYMKFNQFQIQDKYFIPFAKYLMMDKYKDQRLWKVDVMLMKKYTLYWKGLGFNPTNNNSDCLWINTQVPLQINNMCIHCDENPIALLNTESGKGYCSKQCFERRMKTIESYVY